MPYKYQIKKGEENRIFANARNLGNGIVESDTELNSVYLTPVTEADEQPAQAEQMTASLPPKPTTPPAAPAVTPATSVAAPPEPPTNKEATS